MHCQCIVNVGIQLDEFGIVFCLVHGVFEIPYWHFEGSHVTAEAQLYDLLLSRCAMSRLLLFICMSALFMFRIFRLFVLLSYGFLLSSLNTRWRLYSLQGFVHLDFFCLYLIIY